MWTWGLCPKGYAHIAPGGHNRAYGANTMPAHRWAYSTYIAPLAEVQVCDHLCRRRACVNPLHIEPVTSGENVLRGTGVTAVNALKTHCKHGHSLGNAIVRGNRGRDCRTCNYAATRARRAKRTHCRNGHERVATHHYCLECNRAASPKAVLRRMQLRLPLSFKDF